MTDRDYDAAGLIERLHDDRDGQFTAVCEILAERIAQDDKWGEQNHDALKWNAILGEEAGEVAKAVLEGDGENLIEELVQTAAVALAWLEAIDRKGSH